MTQVDSVLAAIRDADDSQEWAHDNVDEIVKALHAVRAAAALDLDVPMTVGALRVALESSHALDQVLVVVDGDVFAITGGTLSGSSVMFNARKKRANE